MKFVLVDYERSLKLDPEGTFKKRFWSALHDGLKRLGHGVVLLPIEAWSGNPEEVIVGGAEAYVFWNGHTGIMKKLRQRIINDGCLCICAEHGWFNRWDYFYLSVNGSIAANLHFADELGTLPVTDAMIERMLCIVGQGVTNLHPTNDGFVVIGQQMKSHWTCRVVEIVAKIDPDREIQVRCHPNHPPSKFAALQQCKEVTDKVTLHRTNHGTAYEDLKGACCLITRNSGVVHEGILQGLPCIASNKHLAQKQPGIILRCHPELINLADMYTKAMQGWRPDAEQTARYLARLCNRQWK